MTNDKNLCILPAEIVVYIFTFLPAKDLIKCREVSTRLKEIVDGLIKSEALWQQHCKKDFPSIYRMARYKSKPGILWYNIYKSLKLWSTLSTAREDLDEFASASVLNEEISNVIILRDGVIGVHTRGGIVYYDIETLEKTKRKVISGTYLRYMENDDTIVVLSYNLRLVIIRKMVQNPQFEPCIHFDNVKTFLLIDEVTYYVTLNDDIYECKLEDLSNKMLEHSNDGVMSLSYNRNKLHILTFQRSIYSVNGNYLVLECTLSSDTCLLDQLSKYNFLESLDWRIYNQWMYVLNHNLPHGPLRDIIKVRMYGDVVFVGSNWGVLRIYYAPYSDEIFDLYNAEPVRQFNFMERYDCPVLSNCPIIQIDISECEDGHTVIVAMPKKLALLKFTHNFKRTASVAMLPYEKSKTKALKIVDFV